MFYDWSKRFLLFLLRRFLGQYLHENSLSSLNSLELSTDANYIELYDLILKQSTLNELLSEVGARRMGPNFSLTILIPINDMLHAVT